MLLLPRGGDASTDKIWRTCEVYLWAWIREAFLILLVHQQMVRHLVIVDPTTEKLHWGKQSLREMQNG